MTQAAETVDRPPPQPPRLLRRKARTRWDDALMPKLLFLCGLVSILTTIGIVVTLLTEAVSFFGEVSLKQFFFDTRWAPLFDPQHFGIWPLITGTLMVAAIAAVVAIPVGLATAIFLSEYAPNGLRRALKPTLEVLAGIPTVVYGYFALTFVTPHIIRNLPGPFADANIFNALSAGLVVGVMIIPMVASLSEDAMLAVPKSLRDGARALGATRFEVATRVVVPAALSGIVASFILALARAAGETMIVAIAAGATPNIEATPLESIQTMTGYIVQVSLGDTPHGTIEYKTIFVVGLMLFLMTLGMNLVGHWIVKRFREKY